MIHKEVQMQYQTIYSCVFNFRVVARLLLSLYSLCVCFIPINLSFELQMAFNMHVKDLSDS